MLLVNSHFITNIFFEFTISGFSNVFRLHLLIPIFGRINMDLQQILSFQLIIFLLQLFLDFQNLS